MFVDCAAPNADNNDGGYRWAAKEHTLPIPDIVKKESVAEAEAWITTTRTGEYRSPLSQNLENLLLLLGCEGEATGLHVLVM
jgi:hypothetical protein